ncbi:hypothetical protein KX729_16550 [Rhizobium sp. XQZ8]|uniref:hypothetical protein n=1 Tax=Rhizobium populisoli TaxID=2859785 RepID=UPI001CA477EE|nr:hypothetical protein [Rhizobium populisoli]MBW6423070.1 hypothetical protein [Rhizobium populisoli]
MPIAPTKTLMTKTSILALGGVTAILAFQAPAQAADPVRGYYAERPHRVYVQRERPRVIRTTYVRRVVRECQTLKVTEPNIVKFVDVCFKPLDLSPDL